MIYYERMENLTSNSEEILTEVERDDILSVLFEWKEGELNASSFLYKWKWAELYEKASSNEDYPFTDIEIEILEGLKSNSKFKNVLEKTEFITDVWSWDGQKAITLLKWTGWTGTYIAEDPSEDMLKITKKNLVNHAPDIKCWNFQVLNDQIHLSSSCPNNMYLFLWGTIWNMSDEYIIEELKNMDNHWIINGNKILLSYFTAPETKEDIDKLIRIYSSRADRAFHENGIDMLWLSRDDFEYDVVYELDEKGKEGWPFPWKIKWIIRAKRDCIVQLGNWREINIEKWKEFTLHYSRRFSKEWIEKLFKKSWCNIVFNVDNAWDTVTLLQKRPRKLAQFANKYRKTLLSLLILWSIWMGGGIWASLDSYANRQKEKEKIKQETIDYWQDYNKKTNADADLFESLSYFVEDQTKILMAEYNISSFNRLDEYNVVYNDIIDMYHDWAIVYNKSTQWWYLTAEKFMEIYWWQIIDKYHIPYQAPYEHFKQYKNIIDNTLKFWKDLDISKYKVEEIDTESELSYYKKDLNLPYKCGHYYNLKIVRVYLNNQSDEYIDLIVGKERSTTIYYNDDENSLKGYNLKIWAMCMQDLVKNYWIC